jgi:hypothetical protein
MIFAKVSLDLSLADRMELDDWIMVFTWVSPVPAEEAKRTWH